VLYNGDWVIDTGFVSGTGSAAFYKSSTEQWATIEVTAPHSGTAWIFSLSCPEHYLYTTLNILEIGWIKYKNQAGETIYEYCDSTGFKIIDQYCIACHEDLILPGIPYAETASFVIEDCGLKCGDVPPTPTNTSTPTRTPTKTPGYCNAPTITNITLNSGSQVNIYFTLNETNAFTTYWEYKPPSGSWTSGGSWDYASSPEIANVGGTPCGFYGFRLRNYCSVSGYSDYSNESYFEFVCASTPTPTTTPTKTPGIGPTPSLDPG